jgi:hypothetical protein
MNLLQSRSLLDVSARIEMGIPEAGWTLQTKTEQPVETDVSHPDQAHEQQGMAIHSDRQTSGSKTSMLF